MIKQTIILLIVFTQLLLSGCGDDKSREGGLKTSSPEYAATKFFYAIYDSKNITESSKYATPKLRRIIKSYGSNVAVARHLLNMQFDEVVIEVDRGSNLRESYGDKATISLIFNGRLHGNKKADIRTVKMVKRQGNWLVEKIKDDPYAR